MRTGRKLGFTTTLACTISLFGCVQSGPLANHRTTVGTLKASVSELEFEKEQLRKQVAQLKTENRRIEDRLAQEETQTGELSARLDDARGVLRGQGLSTDGLAGPARPSDDPFNEPAAPANRNQRSSRKPPFARIPGGVDTPTTTDDSGDDTFVNPRPSTRRSGTFGPQSRLDDRSSWMPVARGSDGSIGSLR